MKQEAAAPAACKPSIMLVIMKERGIVAVRAVEMRQHSPQPNSARVECTWSVDRSKLDDVISEPE
jgi:hypothetical protein